MKRLLLSFVMIFILKSKNSRNHISKKIIFGESHEEVYIFKAEVAIDLSINIFCTYSTLNREYITKTPVLIVLV